MPNARSCVFIAPPLGVTVACRPLKVHRQPPVYVVDDFLTGAECDELMEVAGPLLQRSKTHAAAGSEASKGRTSLTCHLRKTTQPCPAMLAKIKRLTDMPYGNMELPQVARYCSSQRYIEHYDGVDPHTEAGKTFCAVGGQRVATVSLPPPPSFPVFPCITCMPSSLLPPS